jgi:uncharacterized protein (DUF2249 family)
MSDPNIRALQTGKKLRVIADHIAEKTASELDGYYDKNYRHFEELKFILNEENSNYASQRKLTKPNKG